MQALAEIDLAVAILPKDATALRLQSEIHQAAAAAPRARIIAAPTSIGGGELAVTWSGIPAPSTADWIGLFPVSNPDATYIAWRFTTGTADGWVTLVVPAHGHRRELQRAALPEFAKYERGHQSGNHRALMRRRRLIREKAILGVRVATAAAYVVMAIATSSGALHDIDAYLLQLSQSVPSYPLDLAGSALSALVGRPSR